MYSCTAISKPHIHDFRIQIYFSPYREFPICTFSLLGFFPNDKIALFRNPQKLSKHKTDHNLAAGNDDIMFLSLGDIRGLRSTKMSSLLGSNNFRTVLVFIVPHLLWHGISVFLVYPREPPHEIWRLLTRSLIVNGSYDPRPRQKFNYNTQTVV